MVQIEPGQSERSSCTCLMILGNEEPTIRLCMDSLLSSGCFDEYILVQDTRTKDRTPGIVAGYASRYPQIRILWHNWKKQDYSAARNHGLRYARTKRLYWQDGDEILLDPAGIRSLLQNPEVRAYHIWQISPTPFGAPVQTHQLRLWPNLTGVKWELPVHEQLAFSIRKLGVPETITPYRVKHYGYVDTNTNTTKHRERAEIMREWLRKHPQNDQKRAYMLEQYRASMAYLRNVPAGRTRQ